jgi:hypothetical protein
MSTTTRRRGGQIAIVAGALMLLAAPGLAQTDPPVPGVTGVIVPEGGDGGRDAVGAVAEKAAAGTRRIVRAVAGVFGGGDKATTTDPLKTLELGATVALRYEATARQSVTANATPKETEGRVIELDRRKGVVVVRLADRTTERLQLVDTRQREQKEDAAADAGDTVIVSYVDPNGDRVQVLFRRVL